MTPKQWTREMPQVDGCYLWRFVKSTDEFAQDKRKLIGVIELKNGTIAELTWTPIRYTPAKHWLHLDRLGNPFIEFMALGELD